VGVAREESMFHQVKRSQLDSAVSMFVTSSSVFSDVDGSALVRPPRSSA